jgi:hypothetical protein
MGLLGITVGLAVLVGLSFRSWSVLVLAPLAAMVAAFAAGDPLLAHWTQTFMGAAAGFVAHFRRLRKPGISAPSGKATERRLIALAQPPCGGRETSCPVTALPSVPGGR